MEVIDPLKYINTIITSSLIFSGMDFTYEYSLNFT